MKWSQLVGEIIEVAEGAGAETLKHYRSATLGVDQKSDASPVTEADLAAHHYIVDRLEPVLEGVEVISGSPNVQIIVRKVVMLRPMIAKRPALEEMARRIWRQKSAQKSQEGGLVGFWG